MNEFHHATVQWALIPALGGMGVTVPEHQRDQAEALLRRVVAGVATPDNVDAVYERPRPYARLSAWLYLLIPANLISLPLVLLTIPFFAVEIMTYSRAAPSAAGHSNVMAEAYPEIIITYAFAIYTISALIWIVLNAKQFLKTRPREPSP